MKLYEYIKYDALGLSELVKNKEVTLEELQKISSDAIDLIDPKINVIATNLLENNHKKQNTSNKNGSFLGVPFLLKDTPPMAEGVVARNGSRLFEGTVSDYDSNLMKRFRNVGFNLLGTTTVPEFSSNFTTESIMYGATKNPWNMDYGVGGSSGGAAAAVAAGIVPIAHGGDGGGSLRVPGAWNGVIGLKPTRGRIPNGPDRGEAFNGLASQFAITKSIRDTAKLLDEVNGPDIGAYAYLNRPRISYSEEIKTVSKNLKIAWTDKTFDNKPINQEIKDALYDLVNLLKDLGHNVINAAPQVDMDLHFMAMQRIQVANMARGIDNMARQKNVVPSSENLEYSTLSAYKYGKDVTTSEFLESLEIQNSISRTVGEFFVDYDLLLTPTTAKLTPRIGELFDNTSEVDFEKFIARGFEYAPFTSLFNMTGQPAISLPLGWSKIGLPIGMHFIAKFGDEATLLKLGRQLEIAEPWDNKFPSPIMDLITK